MKSKLLTVIILTNFYSPNFAQNISTYDCTIALAHDFLDINSVKARVNQGGTMWWDLVGVPQYQVPQTDSIPPKHVIFSGAIWMGGLDDSKTLRVAANTYRQNGTDFWPGPLENEVTDQLTCSNFDRISKVQKTEIDNFKAFGKITDNLKYYPAKNNPHLHEEYGQALPKDQNYAPFVDVNKDDQYNIEDGDYPIIKGDQSLYWIINDLGNKHTETNGNPIGVEIKNTAYAYADASSILDTITFYRYDITNRSRFNYTDFVFGLHVDPDLGNFSDDYLGVDTVDNFAFVYNGDDFDESDDGYGENIPILGIAMIRAPYDSPNNQSRLGAFVHYNSDIGDIGQPHNWGHYYGYLNGKWKNGNSITYGENGARVDGLPTKFMYPSNPADNSENAWSECTVPNEPSDRRFVLSSKPFNLPKGATASFEYAVITSFDIQYPCPDISNFKETVRYVQNFYDRTNVDEPTSIHTQILPKNEVQLFYDKANSVVHILSDYTFSEASLYTLQGVEISSPLLIRRNEISLNNHLASGIYLLKLQTRFGKFYVYKLQVD